MIQVLTKATLSRYLFLEQSQKSTFVSLLTLTLTYPNPHWAQLACHAYPGDLWIVP
jgi:hypothetical protein